MELLGKWLHAIFYYCFDTFSVEPVYSFGYDKSYTVFSVTLGVVKIEDGHVRISVIVKTPALFMLEKRFMLVMTNAKNPHQHTDLV